MRRARIAVLIVTVALASLALGCLDFDEQVLTIRYDAQQDRLTIVMDYRGLYAETEDPAGTAFYERDVDEARLQLDRAVLNHTIAFFTNWPLEVNLQELREKGVPEDWAEPLIRSRVNELVKGIRILNAGFYRDAEGRPCGMQVVTIERASEVVALANEFINRQIHSALARRLRGEGGNALAEGIPDYLMPYVEQKHRWIAFEDGGVVLSIPFPDDMPEEERHQLLGQIFLAGEDEVTADRREFRDGVGNRVLLQREGDVLLATYPAEGGVVRVTARAAKGDYPGDLLEYVEQKHGFGLDLILGRSIAGLELPADAESTDAARLIVPLLAPRDRIRALLHAAEKQQLPPLWETLRKEASALAPDAGTADMTREELAALCRELLTAPPRDE